MAGGLFVTGTDTGAGKTRFCALLLRALRAGGVDAVGFKPFCCGSREDAVLLREAADGVLDLGEVNPVWLRAPAAPFTAAMVENRQLDVALVRDVYEGLRRRHAFVVVEGVGGWRVPLIEGYCLSDFAVELGLPVLVVAANRLGALNHTQLTVDSVGARGAHCAGVLLNEPDANPLDAARLTNPGILELLLTVPFFGEVPHDPNFEHGLDSGLLRALSTAGVIPALC